MSFSFFFAIIKIMKLKQPPEIAIVGRANVGKSTLFNRLTEKNQALVSKISGTTRDRRQGIVRWRGREFILIDTGGLDIDKKSSGEIEQKISDQATKALKRAKVILFLVDLKTGVQPADKQLAKELVRKKLKNKIILTANKADSPKYQITKELYRLNLGQPQLISAANGSGCGDLLDQIISRVSWEKAPSERSEPEIKMAIVGKTNVGKSTLANALVGEDRMIVTAQPHTTREAHNLEFSWKGRRLEIVDTAGLKKKSKIPPKSLEYQAAEKTLEAITRAEIVLLITDLTTEITVQDRKISRIIVQENKPLIIVANKWDLRDEKTSLEEYQKYYRGQFPDLWWAPIVFLSAEKGRLAKLLNQVLAVHQAAGRELSESQLNKFLKQQLKKYRPTQQKGRKRPYLYRLSQTKTNSPRFSLEINDPEALSDNYLKFLQKNLRLKFKLFGLPIKIEVIKRQ